MGTIKPIKRGEHAAKNVNRCQYSKEAVARVIGDVIDDMKMFDDLIRNGETWYEDRKYFPKKGGFRIDQVNIQEGNGKLGALIKSFSLPPVIFCGNCKACSKHCYDVRHDVIQPQCRLYRSANGALLRDKGMDWVFDDLERQIREAEQTYPIRAFRYHIGGDIVDAHYFECMVQLALSFPQIDFLVFTKMYTIVNTWLDENGGELPNNLKLLFSRWKDVPMENPYNLPVSFPIYSDEDCKKDASVAAYMETTPSFYWHCGNDCTACKLLNEGCWKLGKGESVGFPLH